MVRLLRSDFYRLFKSKSFYICTIVAMVVVSGSAFLMEWSYRMMSSSTDASVSVAAASQLFQDGITYGLSIFYGGNSLLYIAIITAIFVTSEFVFGTMKNAVSKGFPKYQIYLSKLITMTATTFILVLLMFIAATISATIITGEIGAFTGAYTGQILIMIGVELILHAALTAVFVMIANTVRNNGGVIAINIIGILTFAPLIYIALELLFKNKVKFSIYGIQNNMMLFAQNIAPPSEDILRAILVGVSFFAITTALGIFAFNKMDVK